MKRSLFTLVITMLCVTQGFGAMLGAGTRTLSVAGSVNQTSETDIDLSCMGGYFIRDNIEVGCAGGLGWRDGGDFLTLFAGVFGEYNYLLAADNPVVPFAGASVGVAHWSFDDGTFDESETAIEVTGYGGAKYYLVENLAIGAELRVMVATEDIYVGDDEMEGMDIVGLLRTSFYF